MNAMIL